MHNDMEGVLWHGETEHFPRIKHHMQHSIKNKQKNHHVFLHMVDLPPLIRWLRIFSMLWPSTQPTKD
jgi:hypothetical protein